VTLPETAREIRWEQAADGSIEIRPAGAGCSAVIGMVLVVIGPLIVLQPIFRQFQLLGEPEPLLTGSVLKQLLVGLTLGVPLFVAGASLVFNERLVVVDIGRGEVRFVRRLLLWRSVRRFPRNELQATGVRPHNSALPAGATPRISHYMHDVLIFRHFGEPLVVDHTQWENKAEAQELAMAIAAALGLEQR
jgi:hypothetical protein